MANMVGDIVYRVKRLPKPSSSAEALQPLFEAVSNAVHAVDDKFGEQAVEKGNVSVVIERLGEPDRLSIEVRDNGIGLNDERFGAFCTTDTPFKFERGGKGVGRLLWLDAFSRISVDSAYEQDGVLRRRAFSFVLAHHDQIVEAPDLEPAQGASTGTIIRFEQLRDGNYRRLFPVRPRVLVKHFGSHFLADFLLGKCPRISLEVGADRTDFPEGVTDLLKKNRGTQTLSTAEFGDLRLSSFVFDPAASANFDGLHQLHFVASGRTVITRKIDGLLGIGKLGDDSDSVFHGCVAGEFLDQRVNQERTYFNFGEDVTEAISKLCADAARVSTLKDEISEFEAGRLASMNDFLDVYPSFQFEPAEQLLEKTPKNATKPEEFARALITHRVRRDTERRGRVQEVVAKLAGGEDVPADFAEAVRRAADDIRAEEQRQLTEYVLRRKLSLDVLEVLIRRVREKPDGTRVPHLEKTLHQFLCPMQVRGDDPGRIEVSDHDLWIIDERLAFSRYFASDVPFTRILEESQNAERPDLLIFDRLHGLGIKGEDPLERVMLVELKYPGRQQYEDRYLPGNQIIRYLDELAGKTVTAYNGDNLRISKDCVFHCFVVADIVGALHTHTRAWETTANGRGKWQTLKGDYRGSIEVIEWKDLIKDARLRSKAFIDAAQR